ncbi:MAG: triose-phosphate isomerase [Clostridia bacterium]|nr:triose-phosphate isomerase [Clostridia bacterium]
MGRMGLQPPFFEIGPKNYLYGDQIIDLAMAADEAAAEYDIRVIFTTPYADIREVAKRTKNLYVFAPHMDAIPVGRGLAWVLPESVRAAGAAGAMLNHSERPLEVAVLCRTIERARELNMMTIVCSDTIREAKSIAQMGPDMMVVEPVELIGTGEACGMEYVKASVEAVRSVNPEIGVLVGGGIANGEDVYNVLMAGADATGSSSGIAKAKDPGAMAREMLRAARAAWDERTKNG